MGALDEQGALAWIAAHVESTGRIELVHERPWASTWRVPLSGGVAWFKACAPVQAFEPALTARLASRWDDRLGEVLAHDDERAWLLLADAGEPIGVDARPEAWLAVLPRHAELQRDEAAHSAEHLSQGLPDRRIERFPALYEAMLARRLPLRPSESTQLTRFAPAFAKLCAALAAESVGESIQHDDLHGSNVYLGGGTARILDWGDACLSHPFFTPFVTFLHLKERAGIASGDRWFDRLRDAYLEPWGRPSELRRAFDLAQRLGPFAHLFKELRVFDAVLEDGKPEFAPDIAALVRHCLAAAG